MQPVWSRIKQEKKQNNPIRNYEADPPRQFTPFKKLADVKYPQATVKNLRFE